MALVAIKDKYQVVIPQKVRAKMGLHVGDLLEARLEGGKITFTPQSAVDRGIAEGLADIEKGSVHGPYRSAVEAKRAFQQRTLKRPKRPKQPASA